MKNRFTEEEIKNYQNRSEQGGFPQEIGPAQERKGGSLGKPD